MAKMDWSFLSCLLLEKGYLKGKEDLYLIKGLKKNKKKRLFSSNFIPVES